MSSSNSSLGEGKSPDYSSLPEIEIMTPSIKDDLPQDEPMGASDENQTGIEFALKRPRIRDSVQDDTKKPKKASKVSLRGKFSKKDKSKSNGEKDNPLKTRKEAKESANKDNGIDGTDDSKKKKGIDWNKGIDLKNINLIPKRPQKSIPVGGHISVNLMPKSYVDRVEARQAQRRWVYGVILSAVVAVVAFMLMFAFSTQLKLQLQDEQSAQQSLDLSMSRYADVSQTLDAESQARNLLSQAAGNEIQWSELFNNISSALPSGTSISSLSVTNGGTAESQNAASVVMELSSTDILGHANSLEAIKNLNGVSAVEISGMNAGNGGTSVYTMYFTYDTSILTNRFSLEAQ